MGQGPSQSELEAAHCWEEADRVPGRPEMTAYRRQVRLHQARWREANGHPIGSQPIRPRPDGPAPRMVGSRLPLDYAQETGATFLTANARSAATARLASKEAHQSLDRQRLWAELLWSLPMACNLFGDLAADLDLADRAVHTWWPDVPGTVREVRFSYSPGRLDPAYLGNLCDFDTAFVLELGDGTQGILTLAAKYFDRTYRQPPKPARLPRYAEVTARSGTFPSEAIDAVNGTELIHLWLDHQLMHSMLQHPSGAWRWGRHVVVHPSGNSDYVEACARYRALLIDDSTFSSSTVEDLLNAGALPTATATKVRERYLAPSA